MPSQAKLDAAMKAAAPLVDADIAKGEELAPVFVRPRVDQGIQEHREQINAMVEQLLAAGLDAAATVTD